MIPVQYWQYILHKCQAFKYRIEYYNNNSELFLSAKLGMTDFLNLWDKLRKQIIPST